MATLETVKNLIRIRKCQYCGAPLPIDDIRYYPHPNGWDIEGLGRVWLYIRCPKCGYDWSLWKLGVPR